MPSSPSNRCKTASTRSLVRFRRTSVGPDGGTVPDQDGSLHWDPQIGQHGRPGSPSSKSHRSVPVPRSRRRCWGFDAFDTKTAPCDT